MQRNKHRTYFQKPGFSWGLPFILFSLTFQSHANLVDTNEHVIVQCSPDCLSVSKKVTALGGTVNIRYQNIQALDVTIKSAFGGINKFAGVTNLRKVNIIPLPVVSATRSLTFKGMSNAKQVSFSLKQDAGTKTFAPNNYIINNIQNGAASLHLEDITGQGVIVAIIDSGTANNSEIVPALAGSVIGGESFVDLPEEPSATSTLNGTRHPQYGDPCSIASGTRTTERY